LSLIVALSVSVPAAFAGESSDVSGPYFKSAETGVVPLMTFGGNATTPLGHVTKLSLTLLNANNAQRFIRLSNRGTTIRVAGICAVNPSQAYLFQDATVMGYAFVRRRDGTREAHIALRINNWSVGTHEKYRPTLCG
jgi:hypothetical protein